jgi:hypothetical protein
MINAFKEDSAIKLFHNVPIKSVSTIIDSAQKITSKQFFPKNYLKLSKGYIDSELSVHKRIDYIEHKIKGDIINTSELDIKHISQIVKECGKKNIIYYNSEYTKSLRGKIVFVTKDNLERLHSKIGEKYSPKFVHIVLKKNDIYSTNKQLLHDVITWSSDTLYRSKNLEDIGIYNSYQVEEPTILDSDSSSKKSIEELLQIKRIDATYNDRENELFEEIEVSEFEKLEVLNYLDQLSYTKRECERKECRICIEDNVNVKLNCDHMICYNCLVCSLLENAKPKCPFCNTKINLHKCKVYNENLPSNLSHIKEIIDKGDGNNKYIVYCENKKVSKALNREFKLMYDNLDPLLITNKTPCKKIDKSKLIIASHNELDRVKITEGITDIITDATYNEVITDNRSYGNDFIEKKSCVTLNLLCR